MGRYSTAFKRWDIAVAGEIFASAAASALAFVVAEQEDVLVLEVDEADEEGEGRGYTSLMRDRSDGWRSRPSNRQALAVAAAAPPPVVAMADELEQKNE